LERLVFQDKAQENDVFASYAGAVELTAELARAFIKEILVSSSQRLRSCESFGICSIYKMKTTDAIVSLVVERMPEADFQEKDLLAVSGIRKNLVFYQHKEIYYYSCKFWKA